MRGIIKILDDIVKEYKRETPKEKRDWRTYEQRLTQRMKMVIRELEPLIEEAVSSLGTTRGEEGQKTQTHAETENSPPPAQTPVRQGQP